MYRDIPDGQRGVQGGVASTLLPVKLVGRQRKEAVDPASVGRS